MKKTGEDVIGKVYRQFSRQKYSKYKAQFPTMRQTEIISKIIKEWEKLAPVAKDNLKTLYESKKYLTQEDISSSEALHRASAKIKDRTTTPRKKKAEVQVQPKNILPKSKLPSQSDAAKKSSQRDDSRIAGSLSNQEAISPKTKKIQKPNYGDYITFYKRRFAELSVEHPRWSASQISSIVKLAWKKTKLMIKQVIRKRSGIKKNKAQVTGYRFYRNYNQLKRDQAKKRWSRFPIQTRKKWYNKGNNVEFEDKDNIKLKVLIGPEENLSNQSGFKFLNKAIR